MTRKSEIIGQKEYAFFKIPAFQANGILLKLQRLVLPVIGEMTSGKGLDMDMREIADVISGKLDESVMNEIVMPLFKLSNAASVTDNIKIDSAQNFDKVFVDGDGLADMYELVFLILQYNFGNFFNSLAARFGNNAGTPATKG
jgi:hypothetical protein